MIRPFDPADEATVLEVWMECDLIRPWNDARLDIARKVNTRPDLFLVGMLESELVCTVMVGYDGHRGWINYLAVKRSHRGQGYGRLIMCEAERRLHAEGCPKVNLLVRRTNLDVVGFYERVGYQADDVISVGKRLSDDRQP